jgi:hypothetical protein
VKLFGLNLNGWRQPKGGRWQLELPRLTLPTVLTAGTIVAVGSALLLGWMPEVVAWLGRHGLPAALGLPLFGMTKYAWGDVDQLEDAIASGRASGEISAAIPGLDSFAMSARRDAAIAELMAASAGTILGGAIVFNIKDPRFAGGAKGDNATDDTPAIQAAIDAAKAAEGVVIAPPGQYRFTNLRVYNKTTINGLGGIVINSGQGTRAITEFVQIAGTADVFVKRGDTSQNLIGVILRDICFNGVLNASNTGGVQLDEAGSCRCERVKVTFANNFAFAIKNSAAARGAFFNTFEGCSDSQLGGSAPAFLFDPAFSGGYVTATKIIDHLHETTTGPFIQTLWSAGQFATDGAIIACCGEANGAMTMMDIQGQGWKVFGNRFETASGVMTVLLGPAGTSGPTGHFMGNSWAAPGGMTWTDSSTIKSPRFDIAPDLTNSWLLAHRFAVLNSIGIFRCLNAAGGNGAGLSQTSADNLSLDNPVAAKAVQISQAGAGLIQLIVNSVVQQTLTETAATFAVDLVATGGFRQTPDGWYQDNVAASQTNIELTRATGRFRAARAGSVTGVVVHAVEARTAGTLTIKVFKNTGLSGAAGSQLGTLTAVLDGSNTSKKATTQTKDVDTFAAGDELYLTITTDGSWTPTTSDIRAALEIED